MSVATSKTTSAEATALAPKFDVGLADDNGNVRQHRRYFTYQTTEGLVAGYAVSVMFTIDRAAKDVWPCFKDFNLWQGSHHHYSGVVGDLEGKTYRISSSPDQLGQYDYHVIRVIPEHLIVVSEPVPADGSTGGVPRGFHVFMLNEHQDRTVVTIMMEHSCRTVGKSAEESLKFWKDMVPELQTKWREHFIPALQKLVESGPQDRGTTG